MRKGRHVAMAFENLHQHYMERPTGPGVVAEGQYWADSKAAAGLIGFGRGVQPVEDDGEPHELRVEQYDGQGPFLGVALYSQMARGFDGEGMAATYHANDPVTVLRRGRVWVPVTTTAEIQPYDPVFVTETGFFQNAASVMIGGTEITGTLVPGAEFRTGRVEMAGVGMLAIVEVNLPANVVTVEV